MALEDPFILAVAPNGARLTKQDHPAVPLSAGELASEAASCVEAGASLIHVHVRAPDGGHSLDPNAYREALAAIRGAAGAEVILQITTEAVGRFSPEAQMQCVRDVRPEAVSLAVRELAPDRERELAFGRFLAWLRAERIAPQFIVYDRADLDRFHDLRRRGVIPFEPAFVMFVLGRYSAGQVSAPADLLPFLTGENRRENGLNDRWMVCAFGPREAACALTAAALGGHSRVGFENNTRLADGSRAPNNAALVAQAREGSRYAGRILATPARARDVLAMG